MSPYGEIIDDFVENEINGSSLGGGSPLLLPAAGATERIELLQSVLGRPIPLAYGRHIVGGNVIFQELNADGSTTYFIALGEGEWDAIETLWINGKSQTLPDTARIHLHKGIDGELGTESAPGTSNQKICQFYPAAFTPKLTFARIVYLALKITPDIEAPSAALDVRGVYKTRKVRVFDGSGNQTAYQYSSNPAWTILDLIISRFLKPHGLINEALTAGEKAQIDFQTFVDASTYCDGDPGDGVARFATHVAFTEQTDLFRALDQMLITCRGYLIDRQGKIALYVDKARSSEFTANRDAIGEGSLSFPRKDIRNLANKLVVRYRSLSSGGGSPEKDFQAVSAEHHDHTHQDQVGRIITAEIDLGNTTPGRAARLGNYMRDRSLVLADQARMLLLPGSSGTNPIDLLPGDRILGPKDSDAWDTRDYEILEITDEPNGSREIFAQEYRESIFYETLSDPTLIFGTKTGADSGVPTVPTTIGVNLAVSANGRHLIFGIIPTGNTLTVDFSEIRMKRAPDNDPSPATLDLRNAAEGGSDTGLLIEKRKLDANGTRLFVTVDRPGRYFFAASLHNAFGWSSWTDGSAYAAGPSVVPLAHSVSTSDIEDTGPPQGWSLTISPGPDGDDVVVKATRPTTNGVHLLWILIQVKDASTGVWRALDENAGAASTKYDGSAIAHFVDDEGRRLRRASGTGFGSAAVGDLVMLDVRGGQFQRNHCKWGTIETIGSDYIDIKGEFHPQVNSDLRIKIVKPHWTWNTEGYLGNQANQGVWGKFIADLSVNEFVSDPIKVNVDSQNIQARAWFENHHSRSDASTPTDAPTVTLTGASTRKGQFTANHGVFFEGFDAYVDDEWEHITTGAWTTPQITDSVAGGRVLDVAGSNWIISKLRIPYDPSKLYRMRVRARRTATTDAANQQFFCGLRCYQQDKTTPVQLGGSEHWRVAQAVDAAAWTLNEWQVLSGFFKGAGAAAGAQAYPDSANPGPLLGPTRYFSPTFLVNHANGPAGNVMQVDEVAIDVFERDDTVLPSAVQNFSVTGADGWFRASWTRPATGNNSIDEYLIQYATDSAFTLNKITVRLGDITYKEGFDPDKTYFWRISAHNLSGLAGGDADQTSLWPSGWGPWTNFGAPTAVYSGLTPYNQGRGAHGIYLETFESHDVNAWEITLGAVGTITNPQIADSVAGGKVFRAASAAYYSSKLRIPYDTSKLYRMRIRVRRTATTDAAQQKFYCGVRGFQADKTTVTTPQADLQFVANAEDASAWTLNEWQVKTGWFKGVVAGASGFPSPDPTVPGKAEDDIRYMSPMFILNWNGPAGNVMEIDEIAIDVFDEDALNRVYNAITSANNIAPDKVIQSSLLDNIISNQKIVNDAVTSAKIATDAITTSKIVNDAITEVKIATDAITSAKIAANAVTTTKIVNDAITSAKIVNDAITDVKIATNAITTTKIVNDAITEAKIALNAVTTTKIADDQITTPKLVALSVTSGKLAALSVVAGKIAADAVTTTELAALSVTSAKIAALSVIAGKIAADAVTATEIAALSVTSEKIAALSVTSAKIAAGAVTTTELAALSVTSAKIAALSVVAGKIAADAVTTTELAALSVTSAKIAALSVIAGKVAASSITSTEISVAVLSAISADVGTITAGTITGALIRTAASGRRVEIDSTFGLRGFDSTDVQRVGVFPTSNISIEAYKIGVIGWTTSDPFIEFTTSDITLRTSGVVSVPHVILSKSSGDVAIRAGDAAGDEIRLGAEGISTRLVVDGSGINVGTGNIRMAGTQVLTTRRTGWGAPTGTATRTAFDTSTVTLEQLAERVKALTDDLTTHGLIGA